MKKTKNKNRDAQKKRCLFCVETLVFLAESIPLDHLLAVYLLTVKRLFSWLLLFCGYNVSL